MRRARIRSVHRSLLLVVVGCGGDPELALPAPTLLAEHGGAVARESDGCFLWVDDEMQFDRQLIEGGPGCPQKTLDHAGVPPEAGGSAVIAGPDATIWAEIAGFVTCTSMRAIDATGARALTLTDRCRSVPIDQFGGSVVVASGQFDGKTTVERLSLATGELVPWMQLDGDLVDAQVVGDQLYISLHQNAGTYVAQVRRSADSGALPISFSNGAVDAAGFTPLAAGGIAMLDVGVGDAPAQIMAPPNTVVADLGQVDVQGLYETDAGLWTIDVLNQSALNVAPDGTIASYSLAVSEVPVRLFGDQLAVRDYDDDAARSALYLQPLTP